MGNVLRRVRGGIGNALVWGVAWFAAGLGIITAVHLGGSGLPLSYWSLAPRYALSVGVTGFLVGGGVSMYLGVAYAGRRLEDLRPSRFALGGGVISGLLVVALGVGLGALTGFALPPSALVLNGLFAGTLGGLTSFATLKLAQTGTRGFTQPASDRITSGGSDGR